MSTAVDVGPTTEHVIAAAYNAVARTGRAPTLSDVIATARVHSQWIVLPRDVRIVCRRLGLRLA